MKSFQWLLALAVAGVFCPLGASADGPLQGTTSASAESDYYAFLDEQKEGEVEAPPEIPLPDDAKADGDAVQGDKCGTCDPCGKDCGGKGCGFGGGLACMCEGDPWSIWSKIAPCAEERCGLTAGGWIQIGYHTEGPNGDGTGMFNDYPGRVQLQQAWGWIDKAIDPDRCQPWDWGFHLDYVYGTDGPDTQAFGGRPDEWDNPWDNGGFYGSAIPQLYAAVAYNDLTVKLGHFYTICGYEVVQAPDNFFYSHAFTMYNAEPFTHTGVLAEYGLNDNITLWGGYTAGWDTGFTRNAGDIFLGGFSVQVLDNVTFIYTTTMGHFGGGVGGSDDDGYSHSIVVDVAVTEKLNYVFQSDYVDNGNFLDDTDRAVDKAWGINQYVLYWFNDCIGAGARIEYFDDERYGGEVWATTLGLNIKPHANVIVRPEVRWEDWDPATGRQDATLFGMDMILIF